METSKTTFGGYMKKLLFILIFTTVAGTQINAQKARVGILGGLNFSDLNLDNIRYGNSFGNDISSITTFSVGAVLEFNIYENLYLQIEPMYTERGGAPKIPIPFVNLTYKSSYIEFPILFKAKVGKTISPYILGGASLGFMLESGLTAEAFGFDLNMDIENLTESFNFGIEFGLGVEIPISELTLFVESRYTVGLKNIIKNGTIPFQNSSFDLIPDFEINNSSITTRDFRIVTGLTFPLSVGE